MIFCVLITYFTFTFCALIFWSLFKAARSNDQPGSLLWLPWLHTDHQTSCGAQLWLLTWGCHCQCLQAACHCNFTFKYSTERFLIFNLCVHTCVCVCIDCVHACKDQKTAFKGQFSPSTMWVLDLNSSSQAWWQGPLSTEPSCLAHITVAFIFFYVLPDFILYCGHHNGHTWVFFKNGPLTVISAYRNIYTPAEVQLFQYFIFFNIS